MEPMSRKRTRAVVIGLMFGMLLGALDQTVVGTAMPRIIASLGGLNLYSWVFTAYMLTSTASVPVFGKLSDLFGRKYFYLAGLVFFMLGSALSGTSQSMTQLIVFRGLQGLGGGVMMANSLAIVGDIFPPAQRGKWQGVMGAVFGLASIIGPTLGGYLTDQLNWRWVFYINLPAGLIAVLILWFAMPAKQADVEKRQIDFAGAAALILASVPMLLAFSWAGTKYAWGSPAIVGLLVGAAVFWVMFALIEMRAAEPILPPDLFKNNIFTVSSVIVFLTGMAMFGSIMFIPLFIQFVIGASATNSGMLLTPMMLALVASSAAAGQVITRTGRYRTLAIAGVGIMGVGMWLLAGMNVHTTGAIATRNMIMTGIGLGITMPVFMISVQNSVAHARLGVASAAVQFFRSIGGTIGVAVMGSLLTTRMNAEVARLVPPGFAKLMPGGVGGGGSAAGGGLQAMMSPDGMARLKQALSGPLGVFIEPVVQAYKLAVSAAIREVFLIGLVGVVVAWVAAFFLKEIPLRRTNKAPEAAERALTLSLETEEGGTGGTPK